jgi:hypothetical protein
MLELLTILTLCTLIYFLVRKVARKRRGEAKTTRTATGVDAWIAGEVAKIVAKKLALSREDVNRSMGGDPDADIVSAVERVVSRVEVVYERVPGGQLEVRADVHFEDGTRERASKTVADAELPLSVREELSRNGASQLHRGWSFPWAD